MPDQNTISSTSQAFLDIHDITNNIAIMKNGSSAIILTVNAMNFGLLAEQEQDAVIYSYAGLLNSINYPIQILIQSQTKDASSYLQLLEKREEKTTDKTKKAWIRRYSKFVSDLIKERNVLDKKFFVVIPASALEMGLTPGQDIISGFKEQTIEGVEKSIILEKAQNLLEPKKDHLIAQFNRLGLYARQLTTQEIIRLFYTNYNPEATEGQQITNSQSYTTALVQAQIRGDYMKNPTPNPFAPAQPADDQPAETQPAAPAQPAETQPAAPAAAPAQPAAQTAAPVADSTPPSKTNLTESPITQAPATPTTVAPSAPAANPMPQPTKPIQPQTPPKANPTTTTTETVEITQPQPNTAPQTPQPAQPTTPPTTNQTADADLEVTPEIVQENINNTLNQMTEKTTQ